MFKGQSCYPISPSGKQSNVVSSNDQLIKILERFPKIDKESDLSFASSEEQITYVDNCITEKSSKSDISSKFSKSSPELVDLLKQMLEINPHFRPSAKQLLKHKVFDSVRQEQDSKMAAAHFRVKIKMDINEDAINYQESDFRPELKMKFLKALVKESKKLNQC